MMLLFSACFECQVVNTNDRFLTTLSESLNTNTSLDVINWQGGPGPCIKYKPCPQTKRDAFALVSS